MNGIDYLLLWVVGFSILFSVLRGSRRELIRLFGWVFSFLAAIMLAGSLEPRLGPHLRAYGHPGLAGTVAFLLIFAGIKLPLTLAYWWINRSAEPDELTPLSRILAVGWGIGRGIVLLLAIGTVWLSFDPPSMAAVRQSRLAPWCIEGAHRLTVRLVPASILRDRVLAGYGHYRHGGPARPVGGPARDPAGRSVVDPAGETLESAGES
ncbi:MAG: CvpA family protein [Magnetococcales bacterium]|nr:CvpA family protein [Magnetococcales bacterium]